jgi:hypothetical protein
MLEREEWELKSAVIRAKSVKTLNLNVSQMSITLKLLVLSTRHQRSLDMHCAASKIKLMPSKRENVLNIKIYSQVSFICGALFSPNSFDVFGFSRVSTKSSLFP